MARRPAGPKLVDGMDGSTHAKKRLRVILETISGERTIASACEALGISEARFHELRAEVLQVALSSCEPGTPGRPAKAPETNSELSQLQAENRELRLELRASHVREEIALAMPHLLRKAEKKSPKVQELFGSPPSDGRKKRT